MYIHTVSCVCLNICLVSPRVSLDGICDPYAAYVANLSIVYFSHATSVFFLNTYLSDSYFINFDSDSGLCVSFLIALSCVLVGATRAYSYSS